MGELLNQRERLRLVSISRAAELLCMDRKTVSKRIADANIAPAGMRDGYPVYDGRRVCEACLLPQGATDGEGSIDPRNLKPMDRRAWYQSERERMAVEAEARQLIPAIEVHAEMAEMARGFVQFLDTLPDALERRVHMRPDQIEALHAQITTERTRLHLQMESDVSDEQEAASG